MPGEHSVQHRGRKSDTKQRLRSGWHQRQELIDFFCKMHSPQEKRGGGKEDYGFELGHLVRLE